MVEMKKKIKKEVEVTVTMDLVPFWLVRVIRVGGYNNKVCVYEQEFAYEPAEQEIADVLVDCHKQNVFASVVKNYRLVELKEHKNE